MFQLKFAPSFYRQREALLAENAVPPIAIPQSIEECLAGFHSLEACGRPGRWRLWMETIRVVRPLLLKAALISLLSSACAAASTLAAMQILKTGQDLHTMWAFSVIFFLMNLTAQIGIYNSGRLRCWVGLGTESHLVARISQKLLRLSSAAAARQSSGNLKILITSDVRNVGQFLDNAVRNLIPALASLAVIGPLLVHFSGRPGLFGLFVMTLVIPVSVGLNAICSHYQMKSQSELDKLTALAGEWVKNIRLIRYLSWNDAFQRDVSARLRQFMTVSVIQHVLNCLIYGLSISWWMVSATGVVVIARWMNYPLDLAGFFGSLWLLTFMAGYFTHLPNTVRLYGLAAPSIRRIVRLLSEAEQSDGLKPGETMRSDALPLKLTFENIRFQYSEGKPAIQDLSFDLDLHRQTAIIGEIGSGKTTLLKLICGEFPPDSGSILVHFDNGDIREFWTRPAYPLLRKHLAYVPQEAFVSSDLFHMNITLSTYADNRDEDIAAAAYWAELEADLSELPDGLSQEIGESGVNLSGGQRQRLNLARAFYSRRSFMVLDDTMSAVDTKTETILMDRLVSREGGFLLVTHRTGELLQVEDVIVMKAGRIVERGDPKILSRDPDSQLTRVLRAYESESVRG
jgi:ABC-type multidrug transport system fused ATPase/permease subunit